MSATPFVTAHAARGEPPAVAPAEDADRRPREALSIDAVSTLDRVPVGRPFVVHEVVYPEADAQWPQRLEEIGFLPGERVLVLRRGLPGGEPLAVRIGHSTFALRRNEASCVQVRPWPAGEVAR